MKLDTYIEKNGIKIESFAKRIGVSLRTLYNILHGSDMKLTIAQRIVDETGGKINYIDLIKLIKK